MQPAFDHSLTFRDLILRVAELNATSDESGTTVGPPTDAIELDRIKRAINDAAADIARKASWRWLRQTFTITLAPDATRYALHPGVVSAPFGRITWTHPDGRGSGGGTVLSTHTDRLLHMLALSGDSTGAPRYCAVRPALGVPTSSGSRPRIELLVWPSPDLAYTLTATFSCTPVPLSLDSDRGIWPPYMDLPIVRKAYAMMLAYTDPSFAAAQAEAQSAIAEARAQEGENTNRHLGRMGTGIPQPSRLTDTTSITIPDIGFTME